MSEYDKLMRTARYSPTTGGNMVIDKNGAYCSIEAIEQLELQLAERDAEIDVRERLVDKEMEMMNLEQCKEICSGGWPSNQREQARFDAEQWLIQEVERLQKELSGELNEGFNMAADYFRTPSNA